MDRRSLSIRESQRDDVARTPSGVSSWCEHIDCIGRFAFAPVSESPCRHPRKLRELTGECAQERDEEPDLIEVEVATKLVSAHHDHCFVMADITAWIEARLPGGANPGVDD